MKSTNLKSLRFTVIPDIITSEEMLQSFQEKIDKMCSFINTKYCSKSDQVKIGTHFYSLSYSK